MNTLAIMIVMTIVTYDSNMSVTQTATETTMSACQTAAKMLQGRTQKGTHETESVYFKATVVRTVDCIPTTAK